MAHIPSLSMSRNTFLSRFVVAHLMLSGILPRFRVPLTNCSLITLATSARFRNELNARFFHEGFCNERECRRSCERDFRLACDRCNLEHSDSPEKWFSNGLEHLRCSNFNVNGVGCQSVVSCSSDSIFSQTTFLVNNYFRSS
jgi:hypothetical protein